MSQYDSQFEENLYQLRRDKLAQIAALVRASNPALSDIEAKYPNTFAFTHTIPEARALGDPLDTEALAAAHIEAAIAGRIMAIRVQGKAGFATLQQNGQRLQIYVRKDDVGEDLFALYKLLDLGDHIGVRGYLMRTRTGELTLHAAPVALPSDETPAVRAAPITFLAKAMLALPDKFHGLEDIELRYRRRYLDLFTDTGDFAAPQDNAVILSEGRSENNPVILSEGRSPQPKDPDAANPATTAQPLSATPTNQAALKGTGFSPSINPTQQAGALAPEGTPTSGTGPTSPTDQAALKGTGFSPSIPPAQQTGALAPEGTPTRLPAREVFVKRAAILRSIRKFFDDRHYLEVETPMLHTISGGAAARPFETHHNALDIPLKLRIAPELYLKRLVVGGLDRVYEINRNFRNEGVSTQHNPEFTMLEFYQAYANYHDLMQLTQDLITQVAQEVNGTTLTHFNDTEIDLSHWTKLTMREAIQRFWPIELGADAWTRLDFSSASALTPSLEELRNFLASCLSSTPALAATVPQEDQTAHQQLEDWQLKTTKSLAIVEGLIYFLSAGKISLGKAIAELFECLAEPHLIQPTIIYDFPLAVSPLSKVKPNEPDWVERFEFYIGGFEVGNAFSELNDPDDQRARFEAQLREKERGDDEAMPMDEDYVRALGYGLPPTAGEGIGIDRLTMILTGSRSIRDVILFPLMRPQKPTPDPESIPDSPAQPHSNSAE